MSEMGNAQAKVISSRSVQPKLTVRIATVFTRPRSRKRGIALA